jgi:excisionase family DNA binding protein
MPEHETAPAADPGELLSADQVIDRLVSTPGLRRHAATCVLPAVRVGGDWRFRKADLEAWIERCDRWRDPRRT